MTTRLLTPAETFFRHIYHCETCSEATDTFCAAGRTLLYEAVQDLPLAWQRIAIKVREAEQGPMVKCKCGTVGPVGEHRCPKDEATS